MKLRNLLGAALVAAAVTEAAADVTPIILYDANPGPAPDPLSFDGDPYTAGNQFWSFVDSPGTIINDGGIPAIQITEHTLSTRYLLNSTPALEALALAQGWKLTVNVRLPTTSMIATPTAWYLVNDRFYMMTWGTEADGDPYVTLPGTGGGTYVLESAGNAAYHTYELAYSSLTAEADLIVDGTTRLTGYSGGAWAQPTHASWGESSGSAPPGVLANFNFVQVVLLPEPSTAVLVACGLGSAFLRRRRLR
ncbi:MAG: PEP-CTERM sorting domain-containing protein [Verrucomicrobia bacterium]|nr:PEP-CTERM sorting domain-containing protein [Verrucomicrobiota bacterium]